MVDRCKAYERNFKGKILYNNLNFVKEDKFGKEIYKLKSPFSDEKETVFLDIVVKKDNGITSVEVKGNFRKWFLGLNKLVDLNGSNFEKCISEIGRRVFGNEETLWYFKITQVELGVTLKLPVEYAKISNAFVSYSNFKKIWYEDQSSSFVGDAYTVSVYNKGLEVLNSRKNKFGASLKSPKAIEKLNSQKSFIRFEIKIMKLSKYVEFRDMFTSLRELYQNWNEVLDAAHKVFKKITYVDVMSPAHTDIIKGKRNTIVNEFFLWQSMRYLTPVRTMSLLENIHPSDKKNWKVRFANYNRKFSSMDGINREDRVKRELNLKIDLLLNRRLMIAI